MPSTTRGSILISTANDIGEALVEKLGGVGYSPNEWKDKFNLCGIAPVDSAPALSVLSDSAGTGDERGSILIATADAIGAILNKKYNVLRGFKPKEWASACRKMKALEEGSVASASISSFDDGADTVPLTSCVCNIDANLDGKSAVNAIHTRKNLFSYDMTIYNGYWTSTAFSGTGAAYDDYDASTGWCFVKVPVKEGSTITISGMEARSGVYSAFIGNAVTDIIQTIVNYNINGTKNVPTGAKFLGVVVYRGGTPKNDPKTTYPNGQVEVGSTATTYEPYQTPETKTADLGRTIYGGEVDIVNGTGTVGYALFTKNTADMNNSESYPGWKDQGVRAICGGGINQEYEDGVTSSGNGYGINTLGNSNDILYLPKSMHNNMTQTDWIALAIDITFVIPLATPEDFTFEPVKIDSFDGINNIWNDCGNTAVEYYQAPTPYARKTATGGIANFSDQRTDLPLTKAIANIAPSIAGKSAVNLYQGKKNLLNANDSSYTFQVGDNYRYNCGAVSLKKGVTYTFSALQEDALTSNTRNTLAIGVNEVYSYESATGSNYHNQSGVHSMQYTPSEDCEAVLAVWVHTPSNAVKYSSFMLEVGSSASDYVPYQAPTTYTAELGETVYGGSVDFVSGEVKQVIKKKTVSSFIGTYGAVNNGYAYYIIDADTTHTVSAVNPAMMIANQLFTYGSSSRGNAPTWQYGGNDGNNQTHTFILPSEYDTLAKANNFLANLETPLEVTLTLATPIESEIPGRVISPIEGVNNYWNDAGGDTEIQYFEDET